MGQNPGRGRASVAPRLGPSKTGATLGGLPIASVSRPAPGGKSQGLAPSPAALATVAAQSPGRSP